MPGTLQVSNQFGEPIGSPLPCLTKADSQRAIEAGNHDRVPSLPYGDTPWGEYMPTQVIIFETPHKRMGAWAIPLVGLSGQALKAMETRHGLYIHGGRGSDRLIPTYGCVRLLDDDGEWLVDLVGTATLNIAIHEDG